MLLILALNIQLSAFSQRTGGLERAKQFTLEVPTIRTTQVAPVDSVNIQAFSTLDTTTVKLGDTSLGKGLDYIGSKAKNVENASLSRLRARNAFYGTKVDDVVEGGSDILVEPYRKLSKNKEIPGQAHHLNQNAAFKDVIPQNEGLSIKLEGNIRKDIGSPHYKAHESLEEFFESVTLN